jgi:hypothetical protein
VIRLDAATVLLQWATGGLVFLWVTTRRREVGLGYGWLLRGTFAVIAAGGVAAGLAARVVPVREVASGLVVVVSLVVLAISVVRRRAGVAGRDAEHDRRSARIAAMTGIERSTDQPDRARELEPGSSDAEPIVGADRHGREFAPWMDLVAPAVGLVGLVAAGIAAGGNDLLAVARTLVGAVFLGSVTDAMLLGHWYLVQPGLPRRLLLEQVAWLKWVWPAEVALLLVPTGMVSVLTGSVDDGWHGMLGWFWIACAITTLVLCYVTKAALRERAYSAVMAATGLLYLAILTAFGTDLVARAVLAG